MDDERKFAIVHLYISPGHNFVGHHGKPPGENPAIEVQEIHCVAGKGIEGDRYFDHKENYKGQITFFEWEMYESLVHACEVLDKPPSVFRRNVITRGVDLNSLIGKKFEVQGVEFEGAEECKPCYWMDRAFGPTAEWRLRGHGGLRARILTDGTLRVEKSK
ncbi:MAG TPA: MOSC domain-containing protein [Chthoniobacteraceae bacterium]|nr:MOSC domain-containing protein [Chthoniobacteraceae bacterium]